MDRKQICPNCNDVKMRKEEWRDIRIRDLKVELDLAKGNTEGLLAEVAHLREDKKRLDWMLRKDSGISVRYYGEEPWHLESREDIDKARGAK